MHQIPSFIPRVFKHTLFGQIRPSSNSLRCGGCLEETLKESNSLLELPPFQVKPKNINYRRIVALVKGNEWRQIPKINSNLLGGIITFRIIPAMPVSSAFKSINKDIRYILSYL